MDERRSAILGSLTVVTAASLFGMLGVISRTSYDLGMSPFGLVAWRAGLGALIVAAFAARAVRRGSRLVGWRSLPPTDRAALGVAALMATTLNTAMFVAFSRIPVAVVLLGFYLYPALVAAGASLLGWERLDRGRAAALGLALGGMVAVVAGGGSGLGSRSLDLSGVVLSLGAAVSQAVFVLVSRRGYRTVPTEQATALFLGVSAVLTAALAILSGDAPTLVLPLRDGALLGLLVFAAIFAAAIPSVLFLAGIRWVGPVRAGILMLFEPLTGVLLAAAFLAEAIGPVQAAGGIAILGAALLLQRTGPPDLRINPAAEPEPSTA